jgi:hypothetical protein
MRRLRRRSPDVIRNVDTSPVYSISKVGCWIEGTVFASAAFELRPDQVESQASGVQLRAKPTAP